MYKAVLLLFVAMAGGCTPQQSASLMPMMGMGTSLTSQAANLYFQQERIQQQADLQRQQQRLQLMRNQQPTKPYLP